MKNCFGVVVYDNSNGSLIYLNNFSGNLYHAIDNGSYNKWDNTTIGNYWDNYTGMDVDRNGIGDTPYNITGKSSSMDTKPIMLCAPPYLSIQFPVNNTVVGRFPPYYNITVAEGKGHTFWYKMMETGRTSYTVLSGDLLEKINGYFDQGLWDALSNGTQIIRFYVNDSMGYGSYTDISILVNKSSDFGTLNLTSNADDPDEGNFTLDWDAIYNCNNYSIYKDNELIKDIHGGVELLQSSHPITSYDLSEAISGTYFYIVEAHLSNGSKVLSNCINVTLLVKGVGGKYSVSPFILDDTGGGNYTWSQLTSNSWCSGSGSYGDPFVISTIIINGSGSGSCLVIRNSQIYFNVTNSTFTNSGSGSFDSGLRCENMTRGTIFDNNCSFNNGHGITFIDSFNNTIEDNLAVNNSYSGIFIDPSYDMTVTLNYANNNDMFGICIESNEDLTITENFATGNELYGIYLENATDINVIGNIISNNRGYGILLNNSDENNLRANVISNNPVGIYFNSSNYNNILDNTFTGNAQDYIEVNSVGNNFGDEPETPPPEEPPNILLLLIIIGALVGALGAGGFLVVKSRKTIRERDDEILELMSKKESITEEDIAISKEKHFCVVHRGPIEGYNFICPDCGTYYCIKCIEALKDLENTCWSCGEILDPSKPAKEIKEKDKLEAIVEEDPEIETPGYNLPKIKKKDNITKFAGKDSEIKLPWYKLQVIKIKEKIKKIAEKEDPWYKLPIIKIKDKFKKIAEKDPEMKQSRYKLPKLRKKDKIEKIVEKDPEIKDAWYNISDNKYEDKLETIEEKDSEKKDTWYLNPKRYKKDL